jgi:hypothetical protein
MSSISGCSPPSSSLSPFLALDTFLQQQHPQQPHPMTTTNDRQPTHPSITATKGKKEILLRVADSLFGSSLLEGALNTLESSGIVEIQAIVSRRRMFVVTKRSSSRSQQQHQQPQTQTSSAADDRYFCLMPQQCLPVVSHQEENKDATTKKKKNHQVGFLFCSCRAFFELTKSVPPSCSVNDPQASFVVCKHLLALKLRSALQAPGETTYYKKIETATEEEFSHHVLKTLLGHGNGK